MMKIEGIDIELNTRVAGMTKMKECVAGGSTARELLTCDPTGVVCLSTKGTDRESVYLNKKFVEVSTLLGIPVIYTGGLTDGEIAWSVRDAWTVSVIPLNDIDLDYAIETFEQIDDGMFQDPTSVDHVYLYIGEHCMNARNLLDLAFRNNIDHKYIAVNDKGIAYARKTGDALPFVVEVTERDARKSYNDRYGDIHGKCPRGPYVKFIWSEDGTEVNEALIDGVVTASCREIKKLVLRYYFSIRLWSDVDTIKFSVYGATVDGSLSTSVIGDTVPLRWAQSFTLSWQFDYHIGMHEMLSYTDPINEDIYWECVWLGGTFHVDKSSKFGFPVVEEFDMNNYCTNLLDLDMVWAAGRTPVVPPFMEEIAARRSIKTSEVTVVEKAADGTIRVTKQHVRDLVFRSGKQHVIENGVLIVSETS